MAHGTYRAKIVAFDGGFYKVEATGDDAPNHVRVNFLRGWQIAQGLGVGDHGTLEYRTTQSSGLWHLVKET